MNKDIKVLVENASYKIGAYYERTKHDQRIKDILTDLAIKASENDPNPIPTDSDIEEVAKSYDNSMSSLAESIWMPKGFIEGAKWMRKKLAGK